MKHKIVICILAVTLAIGFGAARIHAAEIVNSGTCGDNVTWSLDSDGVLTIEGKGYMDDYYNGNVPWDPYLIETVVISEGVTSIGAYAFSDCCSLTNITVSDSVTSIEEYAFFNCRSLMSITIPDGVTSIEKYAFFNCSSLTSITIPDSVTSIEEYAFFGCSSLANIVIPNSVTSIENDAFSCCGGLINILIPDGVTSIGSSAFSGCSSLTSITIPKSVTSIGSDILSGCSSVETIKLPCVGDHIGAFFSDSSFSGSELVHVYFDELDDGPGKTYEYYIPASLQDVTVYGNMLSGSFVYGCKMITSLTVSDGMRSIGRNAIACCSNLSNITMPGTVENIEFSAFSNCSSLTSITIPEGAKYIGDCSFSDCSSLTSITIPESVISIGGYAFNNCSSLVSITIPKNVTYIGNSVFFGCNSLESMETPYLNDFDSFGSRFFGSSSFIPATLQSVHINYGSIPANSFYDCDNLVEVTFSDSVESIGNFAFWECSSLRSVVFGESMTSIGESAFSDCNSLTSITFPQNVISIGNSAFSNCSNLTSITIPVDAANIGDSVFPGCENLTQFHIPSIAAWFKFQKSVKLENEKHLYIDGIELTSITIPDNVTGIGDYAFYNCSSLTSITIPDNVTSIGHYAFNGCRRLKGLVIPQNVTSVGDGAFGRLSLDHVEFLGDAPTAIGDNLISSSDTWTKNDEEIFIGTLLVVPRDKNGWTVPLWNGYRTSYKDVSTEETSALNSDNYSDGGVEFSLNELNFTASVIGFMGNYPGIVNIPARVTKGGTRYTVTDIDAIVYSWPSVDRPDINSIIIGKNVSRIRRYQDALEGISTAKSVLVSPENTSFVFDDGILYTKGKAEIISVLRSNTKVSIPNTVVVIGGGAFDGCIKLQSIVLPESVNVIHDNAFRNCSNLKNLVIPNSVTNLCSGICEGCSSLETLTIPFVGGVETLYQDHYPFGYLFGQYEDWAAIPDGFSRVKQYYQVWGMDYDDPDSYTDVSSEEYLIPTSLRSVTVTGGSLYYGAFYNCDMIEEITLGKDVVFTGERAFYGCSSLERINVNKSNKALASDSNGVLYSKDYKTIKCYPSGKKNVSYQIDSRVEAIDEFAFYNCLNLESLYVPVTVTGIPANSIAYYDLTMFVYRGSTAEAYAKAEDIAYKYIGDGKAKNVRVTSEYDLPVIASGEEKGSVIGDYDGVAGVVDGCTVKYDDKTSGLQTVTVTYEGEIIRTQAVIYDPEKEQFFDFGDVVDIKDTERGLAGMYDANGRFLGVSEAIVLQDHETVLIPNDVYENAVEGKLMVIDAKTFAPTAEAVAEGM